MVCSTGRAMMSFFLIITYFHGNYEYKSLLRNNLNMLRLPTCLYYLFVG